METHEFDIAIAPDGQVQIHIRGVKGPGCLEYAKLFEKIIGTTVARELTEEYYQPPTGVAIRIGLENRQEI